MAQLSGVTLNQWPTQVGASDPSIDAFEDIYGSLRSSSPADGPSAKPTPSPPPAAVRDTAPRLDLKTAAEGKGTRIDATVRDDATGQAKSISLFVEDASAVDVTQALSDILDSPDAATAAASADNPELAAELLAQLRLLLEDLATLFPGIDLAFFTTLPPASSDLPDLDEYTFIDIYDHRLWQMAWSNWNGGDYDVGDMFQLSLQSATLSSMSLSFNSDIIDAMTEQQNGIRR